MWLMSPEGLVHKGRAKERMKTLLSRKEEVKAGRKRRGTSEFESLAKEQNGFFIV